MHCTPWDCMRRYASAGQTSCNLERHLKDAEQVRHHMYNIYEACRKNLFSCVCGKHMKGSRAFEIVHHILEVSPQYHWNAFRRERSGSQHQRALSSLLGGQTTHSDVMELRPFASMHALSESVSSLSRK